MIEVIIQKKKNKCLGYYIDEKGFRVVFGPEKSADIIKKSIKNYMKLLNRDYSLIEK